MQRDEAVVATVSESAARTERVVTGDRLPALALGHH